MIMILFGALSAGTKTYLLCSSDRQAFTSAFCNTLPVGCLKFFDVGLLRISESVRAYAYLILSSQASARSSVIGNTASSFTAQSAFLNNFENIVKQRVDIWGDIKRYQDALSYTSSKVDYSVGEDLFMLPSDMELRIKTGTVGYNNKILVSDGNFSLEKTMRLIL